jgi:DNA-3-methyladenine glycosylase I
VRRTETPESRALAGDLKARGWRFIGPTTVQFFMQAVGLINDHVAGCDLRDKVTKARAGFVRPSDRFAPPARIK